MIKVFATAFKSILTAILLVGLVLTSLAIAGSYDSAKTVVVEYSTDDGPHVYWQDDSSAQVIYLCDGNLIKRAMPVSDTLRFFGLCQDSAIEYNIPARPPIIEPEISTGVSRIFVVSDIHGEYEHFLNILKNGKVIDDQHRWIWGDGHVVIDGDVTDRGAHVTECLWLIYRLEQEAVAQGGRVHFVLGNHELMVLRADNRYVNERYLKGIVRKARIKHEDLYGPDMVLGRWLRSKNTIIRINDILFVHGGLSPFVIESGSSLKELNDTIRKFLDLRSSQLAFNDHAKRLFGSVGPFWYRGLFEERTNVYSRLTQNEVETILEQYQSSTTVVGHTPVDTVSSMYKGRVLALDVDVPLLGGLEAILWQDGQFYRVKADGTLIKIN